MEDLECQAKKFVPFPVVKKRSLLLMKVLVGVGGCWEMTSMDFFKYQHF